MTRPFQCFALLLALLMGVLASPADVRAQDGPTPDGPAEATATDPVQYINRGLDNAATLPFGMLQWDAERIFFLYGAGCGRPDLLKIIGRTSGEPGQINISDHNVRTPGIWRGVVGGGRDPTLTQTHAVTRRAGIGRWAFRADQDKGYIWIKADSGGDGGTTPGAIEAVGDTRVRGTSYQANFCGHGQPEVSVHFDIEFDHPFSAADMVKAGKGGEQDWMRLTFDLPESPETDGKAVDGQNEEASGPKRTILGRLGLSWTSRDNARLNVTTEIPEWDFAKVERDAVQTWRDYLGKFDVQEAPEWLREHIYRQMYYTALHPNLFSDVNGEFMGFDGEVHKVRDEDHEVYHTFSGWDTYRTHMPFVSMVWPGVAEDLAQTLVYQAETGGGGFPRWSIANAETGTMMGDPSTMMIATAYAYGARGFEADRALEAMVRVASVPEVESSPGYHSRPGMNTYLEQGYTHFNPTVDYSRSDFALSRMAKQMGNDNLAEHFLRQSNNFKSLASEEEKRLAGKSYDRSSIQKQVYAGINGEGWDYNYQFHPWHNLPFIWETMGGPEMAEKKLDAHMRHLLPKDMWTFDPDTTEPAHLVQWVQDDKRSTNRIHIHNEHSYHTPFLYNWLGKPWKTQAAVRGTLMTGFLKKQRPDGSYNLDRPGQTDLGAMNTWYLWMVTGVYPSLLGEPGWSIGSPLIPKVSFPLGGTGRDVTIITHDAAVDHPYIQKMTVNGKAWTSSWLPFSALDQQQNSVEFWMGDTPNKEWGTAEADLPPSFDTKPGYEANPAQPPAVQ